MEEIKYLELLKTAPEDHFSDEFIQFLRDNNRVVRSDKNWLIIRNTKYWTPENDWLTAFYVGVFKSAKYGWLQDFQLLYKFYSNRELLIKAPHKRTVGLFHVHLIKKQ